MDYQPESPDTFALLQLQMAEELRTKSTLAGLSISIDEPEVLGPEIDNAVSTAGGLLILVEPPTGTNTTPAVFSSLTLDVDVGVLVMEEPELNRCEQGRRIPALSCVLEVLRALHGFRPACAQQMLAGGGWEFAPDPKLLAYRAKFRTRLFLRTNADLKERRPV